MLPDGYTGLVVADTRRAREWELGLTDAGFEVVRVETSGDDAEKGSWQIGVVVRQEVDARNFVTQVIRGDAALPSLPRLSATGMRALTVIGVLMLLVMVLAFAR